MDVAATVAVAAAGTAVGAIADPAISLTTLSSGLRVVSEHVPGALSFSAGVWVAVGARDEAPSICGVSHFLEHLLFKGTHRRSARDIATSVDRVGGDMNAFTAKEFTAYVCRVPAAHAALSIDVLGDVVTMPALRDADVESERQVILEELAMDEDTPDDTAYRLFAEAMFPGHPLGRETAGEVATVRSITPTDVRDFFGANYRAGHMVLAVAGPVPQRVRARGDVRDLEAGLLLLGDGDARHLFWPVPLAEGDREHAGLRAIDDDRVEHRAGLHPARPGRGDDDGR